MKNLIACMFMLSFLLTAFASPAMTLEEYSARQVLEELNLARTEPVKYAAFLREFRNHFQGRAYQIPGSAALVQTTEGIAAVDEAIEFLTHQHPLPPLAWSEKLAAQAAELTKEQGRTGAIGHNDLVTSGVEERIERQGIMMELFGENISYGPNNPRQTIMRLLIDDGNRNRMHRKNQFDPAFSNAGVSCGPHPRFEGVCVIYFSGGL